MADPSEHVYKTVEITGSSKKSIEEAVERAIERTDESMEYLRWFEIKDVRGHIDGGAIDHWQVTVLIGFTLEEPS